MTPGSDMTWKGGDLAMVMDHAGRWRLARRGLQDERWWFLDTNRHFPGEPSARPVLVLDPDDDAQMYRLTTRFLQSLQSGAVPIVGGSGWVGEDVVAMTQTVRDLARPSEFLHLVVSEIHGVGTALCGRRRRLSDPYIAGLTRCEECEQKARDAWRG